MYYAIEKIGYGKRQRYVIKKVTDKGLLFCVENKWYKTAEEAQAAADAMGLKIERIGDLWEII